MLVMTTGGWRPSGPRTQFAWTLGRASARVGPRTAVDRQVRRDGLPGDYRDLRIGRRASRVGRDEGVGPGCQSRGGEGSTRIGLHAARLRAEPRDGDHDAESRRPEDIPTRTCYERPAVSIQREGVGAERWGWDLKPRGGCLPSGFRDRRPRPD